MRNNKFIFITLSMVFLMCIYLVDNSRYREIKSASIVKSTFEDSSLNKDKQDETESFKSVGNYYLANDNWILGKFSKVLSVDRINEDANAINEVASICKDLGKDTYFVSLPHKTNMLRHLYPKSIDTKTIDVNKEELKKGLDNNKIKFLDVDEVFLSNFSKDELEKFYFKTDHHWNGLGAYEAFKIMISEMDLGLSEQKIEAYFSKYNTLLSNKKIFVGSYNRKLDFPVKENDITSYVYKDGAKYDYYFSDTKNDIKIKEKDIVATLRYKDAWDYGGAYMRGTNCNILKIKNENSLTDKKVLVFRDSYQAPMTWLLADAFKEVEIIDPRYIENIDMTYEQIIRRSDSDTVLFLYNSFGFDGMIKEMINKGITSKVNN